MRLGGNELQQTRQGRPDGLSGTGPSLDRKYWVAMGLYAVLGLVAWFWIGEGRVLVFGRPVDVRLIPEIVLAGSALKTWLAHQAEKIRRGADGGK
jgi:hypothetical protein